jgi:RNA polymerase subunit RPABC4/transcription elongation factor Spt4
MALVKCKECGKEISSNAVTCPHCGVPEPGKYGPSLVMVHRKSSISGIALAVKIYIDDEYVGEVGIGNTITFEVIPGRRTMSLRASLHPSKEYVITFSAEEKYSFEVEPDFWGGFKLKNN